MSFESINLDMDMDDLWVEITGMMMDKLQINFEVGKNPQVNFSMNLLAFLKKLPKDKIETLKKLIEFVK